MKSDHDTIGIVGGSGMLGRAIARGILTGKIVAAGNLWISNRSGVLASFPDHPEIKLTKDNQALADACDLIVLSVPPARVPDINIEAPGSLIVSVMAGVGVARIHKLTGAHRVVRAMSSPAAEFGLAYSPWMASPAVNDSDRARVRKIFEACGQTDEVDDEKQIECFTAMTGPVPGFVAFYAECMTDYAVANGIDPAIADRAIRQLFLAGGNMLAKGRATPSDHVQQMIDYAGTTAAGLNVMRQSSIKAAIADGLDASVKRVRDLA